MKKHALVLISVFLIPVSLVFGRGRAESAVTSTNESALTHMTVTVVGGPTIDRDEIALYVSPTGDDTSNGRAPEPSEENGPVASLKRAVELASRLDNDGSTLTINLREGSYYIDSSVAVRYNLTGSAEHPVTIRSYPGEQATLTGGLTLDDFRPLDNAAVKKRLSRAAGRNVMAADIPRWVLRNFSSMNPDLGKRPEVYHDGILTTPARYPNDGWLEIESVPQTGEKMLNAGLDRDTSAIPRGRHYGRFVYPGDRPSTWEWNDNIWIHGYWTWDWSDEYLKVAKIDISSRELTPGTPHHRYGYTTGQRFVFINVLEELDAPGEWYIDKANRQLYYWPLAQIEPGSVVLSVTDEPLLTIENTSHIRIESIVFEAGREGAILITGGNDNVVAGCNFSNFGQTAVVVAGGSEHRVQSNDIHHVGGAGISVQGGTRATLEPGSIAVENNYIHHFAQRIRTYQPAIQVGGVGNRVAFNVVHTAPHMGINLDGNDHILEYNEVYRVAEETGDVGAFYMGRDWTERGMVFRYNFIHDLYGPGLYGVMGIYLDDAASGAEIRNNIFYRAGRAAFIGGGRDVIVTENVFVDCDAAVHVDARGLGWAAAAMSPGGSSQMYKKLEAMSYDKEPYATRYPALATILDGDPVIPEGNRIIGNYNAEGNWLSWDKRIPDGVVLFNDNTEKGDAAIADYVRAIAEGTGDRNNPPQLPQFKSILIGRIGLYEDEYRR